MKKAIVLSIIAMIVAVSCDVFQPKGDLSAPKNIVVTEGGESLTISWDAVANADSYTIYFTNDGSEPTSESSSITSLISSYVHENLDESRTYIYLIEANGSGYNTSDTTMTTGHQPQPIFTLTGDFSSQAGEQILVYILDVPYNPTTNTVEGSVLPPVEILVATPDSLGRINVSAGFDRSKYLGYAIAIDKDSSGTISNNDIVTGSGGSGTFGYTRYTGLISSSFTETENWADLTTHTY